jgi:hypothetical protein
LPSDEKHNKSTVASAALSGGETQALPDHLFWTWFIDNPRSQSSK